MKQQTFNAYVARLTGMILLFSSSSIYSSNSGNLPTERASNETLISKTDELLEQYIAPGWFSGSVLILKDKEVIYDKSFGFSDIEKKVQNTSNTKIRIGSINKHYTATLVLQKIQAGKLSLDDTLEKFGLGFDEAIASKITVRHLLQHKSGFADIFNNEYFKTYQTLKTINDKLPLLMNKPLVAEPGEQYKYSNYGYIVLGAILEKLEGKSFKEIITDNLIDVIGAENTSYDLTDNVTGKAKSYHFNALGQKVDRTSRLENLTPDGGMYATTNDIAQFYHELFYGNKLLNDDFKAVLGNGYKESARTWSEILLSDKAQWSSYGGGQGVSAAAEILIKDNLMVVVLANTDGNVAELISQRIVDVYKTKDYQKVVLPVSIYANNLLNTKGHEYFAEYARNALSAEGYTNIGPRPLNKLGFALLNDDQIDKAISVFTVNTKLFPNVANTFDSLAVSYEEKGDKTNAILNYNKALELDPEFDSSKQALKRLSK